MLLWIASKCVSLQWQAQSAAFVVEPVCRCELLQNVYLCSGKHNAFSIRTPVVTVVNCFKMCIFAVASTIGLNGSPCSAPLWIASKCVSLQWQAQYILWKVVTVRSCELLQNVYLCSGKHNTGTGGTCSTAVVNCFKMCIFAVASTIDDFNQWLEERVVNCFKMCIFAVASTIDVEGGGVRLLLWIASKCVSLQWQAQSSV